jgi:hypothetical protein
MSLFGGDSEKLLKRGMEEGKKTGEKGVKKANKKYKKGIAALEAGKAEALPYLKEGYETGRGDVESGRDAGIGYIDKGYGYLQSGADKAVDALGIPLDAYQGMTDRGERGVDAHWEMLQNPDSVFQSELYKSREQAGLDQLARMQAGRGMGMSGNHQIDAMDYMRTGGLDYFNTLMNQYDPYFNLYAQGAQGLGQTGRDIAGVHSQLGRDQANLAGAQGQMAYGAGNTLGNMANTFGQNRAGVATGTAANIASLRGQQGNMNAQMYGNMANSIQDGYTNRANASAAENANMWGAILGGAGAITQLV